MSSAELTHILAQRDALRDTVGATGVCQDARLTRPGESDPWEGVYWHSAEFRPANQFSGDFLVTWSAICYDHPGDPAELRAFDVLEDMRDALIRSNRADRADAEASVQMDRRDDGAAYIIVRYQTRKRLDLV